MQLKASYHDVFPTLNNDISRVEGALKVDVEGHAEASLIVNHLFGKIPKLVRPTLTLMSAYTWGTVGTSVSQRVIDAAAALELAHVGTMCHDDVIDEAETRRARTSVNTRWGNTVAILAGDFLLASASELAASLGAREASIIAQTFRNLCTGQMLEILDLYKPDRTESSYFAAIAGKTATLLSSACQMGALESGASESSVEQAALFGKHFGIAFQINDDILDLTAPSEALGKASGKDALEGVYTLPVLYAIKACPELRTLLERRISPEDIPRLHEVVHTCGAIRQAATVAEEHMQTAEDLLYNGAVSAEQSQALVGFARSMLGAVEAQLYLTN